MNFKTRMKNNTSDSKIGSPLKIDFRADWTHESIPTAWELKSSCWSLNLTLRRLYRQSWLLEVFFSSHGWQATCKSVKNPLIIHFLFPKSNRKKFIKDNFQKIFGIFEILSFFSFETIFGGKSIDFSYHRSWFHSYVGLFWTK